MGYFHQRPGAAAVVEANKGATMKINDADLAKTPREGASVEMGDWPAVAFVLAFALGIPSGLAVDALLKPRLQSIHMLATLGGGIVGIGIGWLWYRWRRHVS